MAYLATCAHDGCSNILGPTNISGVCRLHNHTDVCRCPDCISKRSQVVAAPARQPGIRAYIGGTAGARVSLATEPWLERVEGDPA